MSTLKRIVGVYLLLVGVAVGVHTVIDLAPLYHVSTEAQPYSAFWNILNPCMALVAEDPADHVVTGHLRMKRVCSEGGSGPVTREYLCANVLYFGAFFIGIMFFWNWFNLWSPEFTAIGPQAVSLTWIIIDAALPLLLCAMGAHLTGCSWCKEGE